MGRLLVAAAAAGIALGSAAPLAAAAPPPVATLPPLAIPRPHYVTIALHIDVDRPAAAVWARVGKFCDIGEWMRISCVMRAGQDGQLGAERLLRGEVIEILVGQTDLSHTYTQPVRAGVPYNLYHGTLEAKPLTASTTRLVYSLFYDNSMLPDDAARAAEVATRRSRFTAALANMKLLAEGGSLPPP